MIDCTYAWVTTLRNIIEKGRPVAPRGKMTLEILNNVITVDMQRPVMTLPERKLSYRFMAAEAYWILSGDDTVAGIAPYNSRIVEFSDDGARFEGAYGPRVAAKLDYVVNALDRENTTRQAGMTIWRENPKASRDIPCTVAVWFSIRQGRLHAHVLMRSSDTWLGLPYDIFNFSMLGTLVCARLNELLIGRGESPWLEPGELTYFLVSSHLYQEHWSAATNIINADVISECKAQQPIPSYLYRDPHHLIETLRQLRESKSDDSIRWWL
jgi:thymidylate synthase